MDQRISKKLILLPAEKTIVRRVFEDLKKSYKTVWDIPGFEKSLLALAKQGYMLRDIGAMFGVSHERVRQWFTCLGFNIRDMRRHSDKRIWSWSQKCFVPCSGEYLSSQQTRPCACGCGKPTKHTWTKEHIPGSPRSRETKRKVSQKAKKRWTSYSPQKRKQISQHISLGLRRHFQKSKRKQ